MCGICGFTQATTVNQSVLKAMCDVITHRGPDGEGQYFDGDIALGHRRLSLIDLEGGNQPMVRASNQHQARITSPALKGDGSPCMSHADAQTKGDLAIVFNGEIYNYQDLRYELKADGWEFETSSDTEVLLVGYLAWGEKVLDRLRGMFAFAIWNKATKELFCARDFFGIKPFYYTEQDGAFIFASEIKSILEHPAYERELNQSALEQYLCFQFSALDETFFKGVFKLKPAHCMTVHADGSTTTRQYWKPSYDFNKSRTYQDTVSEIDEVIRDSVRYHNVADVEVGSFLSSGVDSSYMAACLAKENPDIKTFTVGFSEYKGERDEISWAQELAQELKIENNSKHISEAEYWESLPTVQWHMDEPSADPSAVALYFVDQEASKKVKAVLSGEGADEFFGGYRIYQTPFSNAKVSWIPKSVLGKTARFVSRLGIRGGNYLTRASLTAKDWYYTNANGVAFTPQERIAILAQHPHEPLPQDVVASTYEEVSRFDETTQMQYVDVHFWLVGDILLKTDKMSMAHSLESRVPFLDKEVFEVSSTIPTPFKANNTQTKLALRTASEKAIPQNCAQKEKLGFPVPIVNWLRQDEYFETIRKCFTSNLASMFFKPEELEKLLEEHKQGADRSRKIWIIYMFLMWYTIYFIDRKAPKKPGA